MPNLPKKLLKIVAITALLVLFACPALADAAPTMPSSTPVAGKSQSALAVSPAITEQVVPTGKPKIFTLQVTNITDFPLPISGSVKNFVPLEGLENSSMLSKYDASKWFTITDPDFILQPKQSRQVSITITPPPGSEPGGHYATIYFTPLIPESALTPSTAYLSAQVGTLAFLIVPGHIVEKISVATFNAPSVSQSRTISFNVKLQNSGSVHAAPNAHIAITDWRGHTVANVPLQPGIVLPGTQKAVQAFWHSHAFIGKYRATLAVTYGSSNTAAKPVTIQFWVVPWAWLSGIFIFLVIVTVVAVCTRGRWRRAWRILLHSDDS